ncbi:hypothetical protein F5B22DRAFT_270536 [Xylaria bambusicola]|uniref:uncharacterized protein n=1 Tax=Xylaria bambusicola TaxID=326684 RepID=UPI002007A11C|nr:uncharacterized protein F5B22DRAFT_270536 [Xylaria bambusicola]KAI0526137.1 hypothetical protein F5B22DRAFT_270536 [Xylaria bambusicola]
MTPQTESEVKTLEAIADRFFRFTLWSQPAYPTSHDAKSITRLVENHCLAVREPNSPNVIQFTERCRLFLGRDVKTVELEAVVTECFSHLDALFFFGLLNRRVSVFHGGGTRSLVKLHFFTNGNEDVAGLFDKFRAAIGISLVGGLGLGDLLVVLVHEMVHAWLEIFSDATCAEHYSWVKRYRRHGEMFQRLFRFVVERVGALVPGDLLQNRILVWLNKMDWQVRQNSSWWDCFVSAVIP